MTWMLKLTIMLIIKSIISYNPIDNLAVNKIHRDQHNKVVD